MPGETLFPEGQEDEKGGKEELKNPTNAAQKNKLWLDVCEIFGFDPYPKIRRHATRIGALVRDFKALGATRAEILKRKQALFSRHGGKIPVTAEYLLKEWDTCATKPKKGVSIAPVVLHEPDNPQCPCTPCWHARAFPRGKFKAQVRKQPCIHCGKLCPPGKCESEPTGD